jgi:hypothetical protein
MCYILRLYSGDTGLCESVRLFALLHLVCAQSYCCSFCSCLDRKELLWHVRRVACDVLITSGMIVRSFNDSLLNEHIESITFCKLHNEDEGKVTSTDKRKWPDLFFYYVCYLMTLSHTKLYSVKCYAM